MNERLRDKNGITLVALVITIIILLILAGISIASLIQTGLFERAQEAKEKTEEAEKLEEEILADYEIKIKESGGKSFTNLDTDKTNPEAAMPVRTTVIEGDASKGIVIKDSRYNEWVWVEVPKTIFTTATSSSDYDNIKADLIEYAKDYREGSSGQNYNYTDEYYEGCGVVAEEDKTASEVYTEMYNKMLSSVYANGGFWISRYEVGIENTNVIDAIGRTSHTDIDSSSPKAVSQPDMIPYNFVTCSEAQTLASSMSSDSNKTSSLLFGIQWDLVCKFLEVNSDLTYDDISVNSANWGNYKNSSLLLSRGKYNISPSTSIWTAYDTDIDNYVENKKTSDNESYKQLLTTGASKETSKMNIYDFAGNEFEWTLEHAISYAGFPCSPRGGNYTNTGSLYPASSRFAYCQLSSCNTLIGFRSTLY